MIETKHPCLIDYKIFLLYFFVFYHEFLFDLRSKQSHSYIKIMIFFYTSSSTSYHKFGRNGCILYIRIISILKYDPGRWSKWENYIAKRKHTTSIPVPVYYWNKLNCSRSFLNPLIDLFDQNHAHTISDRKRSYNVVFNLLTPFNEQHYQKLYTSVPTRYIPYTL